MRLGRLDFHVVKIANALPDHLVPIGNSRRVRAAYDETLALYRQSVLTALADVENQLTAISHLTEQSAAQTRVLTSAERALELAKVRYAAGSSPYLEVIETSRTALISHRGVHRVAGQR